MKPLERFLDGLGFGFSDRMGATASWWHCDEDHHGMALVRAPRSELSHYAFTVADLNAMGRVADRLKLHRDQRLIWGPSRHGPGQQPIHVLPRQRRRDDRAVLRDRPDAPPATTSRASGRAASKPINQWGGPPPVRFLLTGFPIVEPDAERPSYAMRPDRTADTIIQNA